jgi:hypothetical protein
MTPFEQVLENLVGIDPWGVAKLAVLLFLSLYIAFAVIIVRQVKLMIGVLNGTIDLPLRALALLHLILSIGVFILAITAL